MPTSGKRMANRKKQHNQSVQLAQSTNQSTLPFVSNRYDMLAVNLINQLVRLAPVTPLDLIAHYHTAGPWIV